MVFISVNDFQSICLARTTPDSGRAIHVGPIHVHPIHVETDSGPIEPIHVWPYSCPNRFMPKKD